MLQETDYQNLLNLQLYLRIPDRTKLQEQALQARHCVQNEAMPLQNRVTPFGEIVASEARGTLMGNRGCLHDAHRTIGGRRWTTRAWTS